MVVRVAESMTSGRVEHAVEEAVRLPAPVVLVCSPQGGQWAGMGRGLLRVAACAEVVERCDAIARPLTGRSIVEDLVAARSWDGVDRIQPAIFTIQVALGAWLAAEGIEIGAIVGHSLGEIAAAHLGGALTLEEAVGVVVTYSQHQATTARPELGMAVIELAAAQLAPQLRGRSGVHIAAHNAPQSTVVSGERVAIDALVAELERRDVACASVAVDVAAHGPHIDPILEPLRRALRPVTPRPPRVALASGMRGTWAQPGDFGGLYFAENLRAPVRFGEALATLHAAGGQVFVELGPHPVLARAMHQSLASLGARGASVTALCERGERDGASRARLDALVGLTRAPRVEDTRASSSPAARASVDPHVALVESALRKVLRTPRGPMPLDAPLTTLGLDSLATIELRVLLEASAGPLPESVLRGGGTPRELARALAGLQPPRAPTPRAASGVFVSRRAPLSAEQARLWFLDRTLARKDTYHVTLPLAVSVRLDEDTLRRALEHVIARHEQLRTAFFLRDGEPLQRALPWVEPPLRHVALRDVEGAAREQALAALLREEASQPFDLAYAPLFRATLVDRGTAGCVLHLVFHHLVVDGWSIHLFLRDLDEAYRALASGTEPELEVAPSYIDATATSHLDATATRPLDAIATRGADDERVASRERLRRWWARELEGIEPLDLGAPPLGARGAGRIGARVPFATMEAVEALARRSACTPFVVLLSALAVLVARITGRRDLVLGTAAARRDVPGRSEVFGFFMNTVPVRCRVEDAQTIEALLAETAAAVDRATAHAELPYDEIVRQSPAAGGLVQVCLVLESRRWFERPFATGSMRLAGSSPSGDVEGTSKFGVTFAMLPTDEGYLLALDHDLAVLPPEAALALSQRFATVLEQLSVEARERVGDLDVVSREERTRWARLNDTCQAMPERPAHELYEELASRDHSAIALVHGAVRLTRGELDARANRLAHHLVAKGLGPSSPSRARVGICVASPVDQVVAMLAIAKTGAAYVPLDPEAPGERLARIAADADLAAWVLDAPIPSEWAPRATRITLDDPELADASPLALGIETRPTDVLYVIYTSGSTGVPKGVEVPHRGLVSLAAWTRRTFALEARDRALAIMSFGFDPACWELWSCLLGGVELHLGDAAVRRSTGRYLRYVREHRITVAVLGANLAHRFVSVAAGEPLALRVLLTGGEPVRSPPPGLSFEVVNTYGITEATVVSTYARLRPGDGLAPIGGPIDNTSVHVLDRGGDVALPGTVGELVVGGVGVARGYVGPAESGRFVEHPRLGRVLFTGDRARLDPDGALWFLGRADDQVKLRGHRIELGEVEAALVAHGGVAECAAIVREDVPGDARLVAYVVPRESVTAPGPDALREHCRARLPSGMVPSHFVLLASLPRTVHDKVDRAALPLPPLPRDVADASHDPVVGEVARLFAQSLGLPSVGADDDYFALGGHSLGLLELLDAIERRWSRELTHAAFLDAPTPRGVARALDGERALTSRLVVTLRTGRGTPLFCVTAGYGDLVSLRGLSERLGPNRPFHALQAQPGAASLEVLAAEYVHAIETLQPRGPYQLAGYSSGGLVAFEIAQQLASRGHTIGFLGLLDTPAGFGPVQAMLYRHGRVLLDGRLELLMRMGSRVARVAHFLARDRGLHAYLTLLAAYRPRPFPGRVTLVVPELSHHRWSLVRRGWERLAAGGLDVVRVAGDHESFIRAPHVEALAEALRSRLDPEEAA
ncbi:MAG: amino acid adenylation domain-containing protein [Sandaracinus sp.]